MSLDFDTVNGLIASMGTMKFFPSDPSARLALVELMGDIATTEDQVRWLVKRMKFLYNEWPGEREMRACFCSKFRPRDGVEVFSTVYSDGIPSEKEQRPALPAGPGISADKQLSGAVRMLAQGKAMPRVGR